MKILRVLFLLALIVFLFIAAEVLVRIYYKFSRNVPFTKSVWDFYDKELGWKGKVVFGDKLATKQKIFFIGDSFTYGCGVEEEYMYYSVVAKNLNIETFVYGGPGYGTLQEYMVLDRYIDQIKPDLIVLQVCNNDLTNNLWELESKSLYNNDLMIRPYLIDGKVQYLYPKFPGKLKMLLFSHSRLLYLLGYNIEKFIAGLAKKGILHTIEKDIADKGIYLENLQKAVVITNTIVAKMKERAGEIPIVSFVVNKGSIEYFRNIFQANNIEFIEDVPQAIYENSLKGAKLTIPGDTHWNEGGHKVCGDILSERLGKLK